MAINLKIHAGSFKTLESRVFRLRSVIKTKNSAGFKRSRRVWTIKRSPHVFSKSQESFGIETYKASLKFTDIYGETRPQVSNYGSNSYIERVTKFACSNHMIPGSTMSWNRRI